MRRRSTRRILGCSTSGPGESTANCSSAWTGTAWRDWEGLGGALTAGPSAVSRMQNHVDVFVRGPDRGLYQRYWHGGAGWSAWVGVDAAALDSAPAAASDAADHVVLVARRGGGLAVKEWRANSGWTPWVDWGPVASPPTPPPPPPDGNVELTTGVRCTPPGGRLRVSLKIRKRAGKPRPRVRKVVFFVK